MLNDTHVKDVKSTRSTNVGHTKSEHSLLKDVHVKNVKSVSSTNVGNAKSERSVHKDTHGKEVKTECRGVLGEDLLRSTGVETADKGSEPK